MSFSHAQHGLASALAMLGKVQFHNHKNKSYNSMQEGINILERLVHEHPDQIVWVRELDQIKKDFLQLHGKNKRK